MSASTISQLTPSPSRDTQTTLSSSLFTQMTTPFRRENRLCPEEELSALTGALYDAWSQKQQFDAQWNRLLKVSAIDDLQKENWSWSAHLGPILGFKLLCVLSGSAGEEGRIPRSAMPGKLGGMLERVAKQLTEPPGWPKIFEEAIIARWANRSLATEPLDEVPAAPNTGDVLHRTAQSLRQNLRHVRKSLHLKHYGNIVTNIELAASYLSIMTLGVVNVNSDAELYIKLDEKMSSLHPSGFQEKLSDVLKDTGLSPVEFQTPLYSALSISPLLLFRTCQLHSARFGRNHYVSFLLSLGDIKPPSLRKLEALIWKNLLLVSQRKITVQEMIDVVLHSIVDADKLASFRLSNYALRQYMDAKFDPVHDHTSFFFPGNAAIVKEEDDTEPVNRFETMRQTPSPMDVHTPSSASLSASNSSGAALSTVFALSDRFLSNPTLISRPVRIPSSLTPTTIGAFLSLNSDSTRISPARLILSPSSPTARVHGDSARMVAMLNPSDHSSIPITPDASFSDNSPGPNALNNSTNASFTDNLHSDVDMHVDVPASTTASPIGSVEDPAPPRVGLEVPGSGYPAGSGIGSTSDLRLSSDTGFEALISGPDPPVPNPDPGSGPDPISVMEPTDTSFTSSHRNDVDMHVDIPPSTATSPVGSVEDPAPPRPGLEVPGLHSTPANPVNVDMHVPASTAASEDPTPSRARLEPTNASLTSSPGVDMHVDVTPSTAASPVSNVEDPAPPRVGLEAPGPDSPPGSGPGSTSDMGLSADTGFEVPFSGPDPPGPNPDSGSGPDPISVDPGSRSPLSSNPNSPSPDAGAMDGSTSALGLSADTGFEVPVLGPDPPGPNPDSGSGPDPTSMDPGSCSPLSSKPNSPPPDAGAMDGSTSDLGLSADTGFEVTVSGPDPPTPNPDSGLGPDPVSVDPGSCSPLSSNPNSPPSDADAMEPSFPGQRRSVRIAHLKRKLEEDENDEDISRAKHLKISDTSTSRPRPRAKSSTARNRASIVEEEQGVDDDVDDVPRFVVNEDKEQKRFCSRPIDVYSGDGTRYFRYHGSHYQAGTAKDLEELAMHVDGCRQKLGLPTGPPPEWSDEMTEPVATSFDVTSPLFFTSTYNEFYQKSTKEVQDLLRKFPVLLLSGRPTRLKCDTEGLEEFGEMSFLRVMHDHSKFQEKDANAVHTLATYEEFLKTDKIVNSLHNPLSGAMSAPPQLSTDLRAATHTYAGYPTNTYVHEMNWGLLAKANAVHGTHVDRTGMCTWVAVEDGMKKWDVAFPPEDAVTDSEVASTDAFAGQMAWGRNYKRGWRWLSFLLYPGSVLIMRPGVVHSVTTMKNCVAYGGHFFSASTVKLSIYSIFHSFIGSRTITNGSVENEQQNLLRILLFWHSVMCKDTDAYLRKLEQQKDETLGHIPNVLLWEDLENLIMLLNYSELVSVITPARYASTSRTAFADAEIPRKRGREIRDWLIHNFELALDSPANKECGNAIGLEGWLLNSLLGQAHKLCDDMERRDALGVSGSTYCKDGVHREITSQQVVDAVRLDLAFIPSFEDLWTAETAKEPPSSYSLIPPNGHRYLVRRKA